MNFPERQYRTYVMSVGVLITFAWNIVSNFLDPGTVFKIRLVKGFDDQSLLEDFTSAAQVNHSLTHSLSPSSTQRTSESVN